MGLLQLVRPLRHLGAFRPGSLLPGVRSLHHAHALSPPRAVNEPLRSYAPNTAEREALRAACAHVEQGGFRVPCVVNGNERDGGKEGAWKQQIKPHR